MAKKLKRKRPFNYKLSKADEPTIEKELKQFTPICLIAAKIGCCRQALSNYIHAHMEDKLEESRESMIDMLEGTLYRTAVVDRNVGSLQFMLDRLGRKRGYGEHIDTTQTHDFKSPITIGDIEITPREASDGGASL